MAIKKVYDADEIMKMAVGLIEPDIENADYNGDGKVTSADARTNTRIASGLSIDTPVSENKGNNIYLTSNAYQNQADAIFKRIQETPDFKYDFNEDAVFNALKEQYLKDGRLAAENAAGRAASLSGGYSNSYGATAAGQAYMGAIDDLYDVVPTLRESAYEKYRDEKTDDLKTYEILQGKADKERKYAEAEREYLDSKVSEKFSQALKKASLGDYSELEDFGFDTSSNKKKEALDFALAAAGYGDFSFLNALGIDTSVYEWFKYYY